MAKLASKTPPVQPQEVEECFATRSGKYLLDDREQHTSNPPTLWFVSETYFGRKLKVVFIPLNDGTVVLRTAYDANPEEIRIYFKYGVNSPKVKPVE